jgi:hypothetical protein
MTENHQITSCMGCGALVPSVDGPRHPYIGASAGCWAVYCEVLAKEFGEYRYPPVHRLTVDAYAAQHPGMPGPQSIKSVNIHLISLCLVLEQGVTYKEATQAMGRVLAGRPRFFWLDPPASLGDITVLDVCKARDLVEHTQYVERWAKSVWRAWSPHHVTVYRLLQENGVGGCRRPEKGRA